MCGVIGIADKTDISQYLFSAIDKLKHRGPNAWGVSTLDASGKTNRFIDKYSKNIPNTLDISSFKGSVGIAHTRYATTKSKSNIVADAQPLSDEKSGLSIAFNGHLQINELKEQLEAEGTHFLSNNDGELLLRFLINEISSNSSSDASDDYENIFEHLLIPAIKNLSNQMQGRGSYTFVSMLVNKGLFAFRDPQGFRPLTFATQPEIGPKHVFTSETNVLRQIGEYKNVRPVNAGELIYITPKGEILTSQISTSSQSFCALEPVYFAAGDSVFEGVEVDDFRHQLGAKIASLFQQMRTSIDVVVPLPETANPIAYELAYRWNKPIGGISKSGSVRSFLQTNQVNRELAIDNKYRYFSSFLKDKSVALVDDSIVRGTTMRKVIKNLKRHGAKEVHVFIAFPPIKYPCYYGIDIPDEKDLLVAHFKGDIEKVRQTISADTLNYIDEDSLKQTLKPLGSLCLACTNGKYIGGNPNKLATNCNS